MTIINAVKKERKGKERKGKGLLYLIAIAVLISTLFIACKNRSTGIDDIPIAPTPITGTSITPPNPTGTGGSVQDWAKCISLQELYNNGYTYFKSSSSGGNFEYILEIKDEDMNVEFKGKDGISKSYGLGANGNKKYKNSEGAELRFGSENNLEDKYIEFKPHNMQNYIKLSLQKKP